MVAMFLDMITMTDNHDSCHDHGIFYDDHIYFITTMNQGTDQVGISRMAQNINGRDFLENYGLPSKIFGKTALLYS